MHRSLVRDKQALRRTAVHEGGHVLTAMFTPWAHPVHKATIIPRGSALGWVSQVHRRLFLQVTMPLTGCSASLSGYCCDTAHRQAEHGLPCETGPGVPGVAGPVRTPWLTHAAHRCQRAMSCQPRERSCWQPSMWLWGAV